MNLNRKKILTHVGIIVLMFAISCVYFLPILQGKGLPQGDIQKYEGMAKAQKSYHQNTGDYSTWCPSMFSGMPGYQITNSPQHSVFTPLKNILTLQFIGRQNDVGILFLYLFGFYIALIALGASPLLALLGALAFGLGSYNIIIIEAGHVTKAWAMSMIAPIMAGMLLCMKGTWKEGTEKTKYIVIGGILFTISLGLQISLNHIQITFYTGIAGVVMGIIYAIYAIKDKKFVKYLVAVAILAIGACLSIASNTRHLLVNQEYIQYTMRGGSELSVTPNNEGSNTEKSTGLDINYAFGWSYGIGETYTILVPGARGGGSIEPVSKNSASFTNFKQDKMPLYWGDQPFTSGPVYFGAIIIFLFIFGLIVVKGPERWWILIATILAIMLSWGSNFMKFNEFIFNNMPLYNKFRTPSMSLVLANVLAVILGVLGLKEAIQSEDTKRMLKALYIAAGTTIGIILIGLLTCGGLSYSGAADSEMARQYGDQWSFIQNIFIEDRKSLFVSDSWRSILFVVLAAGLLWIYLKKGAKKITTAVVAALTLLIVIDLQGIDSRYLNKDNYVRNSRMLEMQPDQYDYDIDMQALTFGDEDFRVLNLAVNTFNDSKPSAFHNQIGGYSAAKLRRYQDLIDFYLNGNINLNVLNMLNGRYVVMQNGQVQRNPDALGNCWFVDEIKTVKDANEEILAIKDFNPKQTAIVNESQFQVKATNFTNDSSDAIVMEHKKPSDLNCLTYNSHCSNERLAIFSEIYYAPDWKVYIDDKPAEYMRANYVLRAMLIPAGDHKIEFRNEAPTMHKLDTLTLIFSIGMVLVIAGAIVFYIKKRKKQE